MKLMGFTFNIEYKQGYTNQAAGALSRVGQAGELQSVSQVEPRWLVTVREENQSNPKLQHFHRLVEQGEAVGP